MTNTEEILKVVSGSLAYLEKRREQLRYAEFIRAGYPIGSGVVESANKLVVEARLKGSGMHWADAQVNPMLALRNVVCSDRWDEAWDQISEQLRHQARERQSALRAERQKRAGSAEEGAQEEVAAEPVRETPVAVAAAKAQASPQAVRETTTTESRRPGKHHPWRRMPISRPR